MPALTPEPPVLVALEGHLRAALAAIEREDEEAVLASFRAAENLCASAPALEAPPPDELVALYHHVSDRAMERLLQLKGELTRSGEGARAQRAYAFPMSRRE
jgi:hypothetical protein